MQVQIVTNSSICWLRGWRSKWHFH